MNNRETYFKSLIHYYCKERLYRGMLNTTTEAIRIYPTDMRYKFYYATALFLEGRYQESLREADLLQEHSFLYLASLIISISIHKNSESSDNEETKKIELKLREKRKQANENALYYASLFFYLINRTEKAKEYIDRLLKLFYFQKDAILLKIFIEISLVTKLTNEEAALLNTRLDNECNSNDLDVIIAKSRLFQKLSNFKKSIEILTNSLIELPNHLPFLIERIKCEVAQREWEQVFETCSKALSIDRHCIEAHRHMILFYLSWSFNEAQLSLRFTDFLNSLELREPKNALIYHETARLISQITYDHLDTINFAITLAERAAFLDPSNSQYQCDLGFLHLQANKISEAERYFKNATKLNENDLIGIIGSLQVSLLENRQDIYNQIASLEEIHSLSDMPMEILYLCALAAEKQHKSKKDIRKYLDQIVEKHTNILKGLSCGLHFYLELNVCRMVNVARMYLRFIPHTFHTASRRFQTHRSGKGHAIEQAKRCLQPLITFCPTLAEGFYLMAQIKLLDSDFQAALCMIDKCLQRNPLFSNGLLLKAYICVCEKQVQSAQQALELALSHDFQIRDEFDYVFVKASILKLEQRLDEAIQILLERKNSFSIKSTKRSQVVINESDKIELDLLLLEMFIHANRKNDAIFLIDEMLKIYGKTSHFYTMQLANAYLHENTGNVAKAISILSEVRLDRKSINSMDAEDEKDVFVESRRYLAYLYLTFYKDRKRFAQCFADILQKSPGTEAHLMLGDAFMTILEPDKAIEVYEMALKKNPKDAFLTRKVGQAYVKAHFYEKAITYYKAAIKSSGANELRYDLADLLYQMSRYEESADVIRNAIETLQEEDSDLQKMIFKARITYLNSKVLFKLDHHDLAINSLQSAHVQQTKVLRRLPVEQPDSVIQQRKFAIKVCTELADHIFNYQKNHAKAVQICKDIANYEETPQILIKMAQMKMNVGEFEEAQKYCTQLLKLSQNNEDSLLIMADLLFCKNEFDSSLQHYNHLLQQRPSNVNALQRMIEAARRTGKMVQLIPPLLQKAELAISSHIQSTEPRSLHMETGRNSMAAKLLVPLRHDPQLSYLVLRKLVEICVNLDNETLSQDLPDIENGEEFPAIKLTLLDAEKFISELKDCRENDLDYRILYCFLSIARKQKNEIEHSLSSLTNLATEQNIENIGLSFAIASGFIALRQTTKARNHLKKAVKVVWSFKEAEYLERSWLLLADLSLQSGKTEMALELLKRTLLYNQSCIRAHEYLGSISEKEDQLEDAHAHFQTAWLLCEKTNPHVGFRFALICMKFRKYVEAVNVCERIIAIEPNYPRVRKEILDKCKLCIR